MPNYQQRQHVKLTCKIPFMNTKSMKMKKQSELFSASIRIFMSTLCNFKIKNMKKSLLLGLSSGILAGIASIILLNIYKEAYFTDFSVVKVLLGDSMAIQFKPMTILLACTTAGIIIGLLYSLFIQLFKSKGLIVFNLFLTIITFATLILPMAAKLSLDLDEDTMLLFPGFAITIHFFPLLSWYTLKPIFFRVKK